MDNQYELVVIQPIKDKPGRRVCGLTVHGKNVTEAIAKGREWFQGSGYAVMQAAQFNTNNRKDEEAHDEQPLEEVQVGSAA